MSIFIESLKRLYTSKKVTDEKLQSFLTAGKITQEEYNYILS